MTLREVVVDHPGFLGLAMLAWVGVIIWVVALIDWMIQGEVEPLVGFPGIAAAVALGYFSFNPPVGADPNGSYAMLVRSLFAASTLVTIVIFPFARRALNRRALAAIDVEAMEDVCERLREKPENDLLRFKLAKLLYERGQIETALAVGRSALEKLPENLFTEEHRQFGRWRRLNNEAPTDRSIPCVECGWANPPSQVFCEKCGASYLVDLARGRIVGKTYGRRLIAAWVASILALFGIALAGSLPPGPAIIVVLGLMAVAGMMLYVAFHPSGGGERA